jgi:predicted molibdopterin-dependent oxidoreductase YjgC
MFRKRQSVTQDRVTITIDGIEIEAEAGEPAAAVLLRSESCRAGTHPVSGQPRAPYCMMGVCFDCVAIVDGVASTQTCLTPVRNGMQISRQHGLRILPDVP